MKYSGILVFEVSLFWEPFSVSSSFKRLKDKTGCILVKNAKFDFFNKENKIKRVFNGRKKFLYKVK